MTTLNSVRVIAEDPIKKISNTNIEALTEATMRSAVNRQAHAHLLTYGMAERAFAKGCTLVQKGTTTPIINNEKIQKIVAPLRTDFIQGIGHKRAYGHSMFTLLKNGPDLMFQSFEPRDYKILTDTKGNIVEAETSTYLPSGIVKQVVNYTGLELDYTYHSIDIPNRQLQQGRSYLEPVWEVIIAIDRLVINSMYYVVRVGAGLFVFSIPQEQVNDTAYMTALKNSTNNVASDNTVIVLPTSIDGESKIEFLSSKAPVDFSALLEFYEKVLAAKTGIPRLVYEGAITGVNVGSEINHLTFMDRLQEIQDQNDDEWRWLYDSAAELSGIKTGEYNILWTTRRQSSEEDEIDLLKAKVEVLQSLVNNPSLQISLTDAQELVGLEYHLTVLEVEPTDDNQTPEKGGDQGSDGQTEGTSDSTDTKNV